MSTEAIFLAGLALLFIVMTLGCAVGVRYLTNSDKMGVAAGAIAVPALIIVGLVYWLATMEVDDAPPGNAIFSNLVIVGIAAPITFLLSFLTVRHLTKRARKNVR